MKKRAVLLWVVYFLNMMIFPMFFLVQSSDNTYRVDFSMYILLQVVSMLVGVGLFWKQILHGAKKCFNLSFPVHLVLGYVARIVLTLFVVQLVGNTTPDNQGRIESMMAHANIFLMFVLVCVVAPVLEELVFREGIIGAFKNSVNIHLLTLLSILLFILLHSFSNDGSGIDWMAALMYLPLTIPIVGMYRLYNDNIFASITMHFINNFVAFLFLLNM